MKLEKKSSHILLLFFLKNTNSTAKLLEISFLICAFQISLQDLKLVSKKLQKLGDGQIPLHVAAIYTFLLDRLRCRHRAQKMAFIFLQTIPFTFNLSFCGLVENPGSELETDTEQVTHTGSPLVRVFEGKSQAVVNCCDLDAGVLAALRPFCILQTERERETEMIPPKSDPAINHRPPNGVLITVQKA